MSKKRKALGRGLKALIPGENSAVLEKVIKEIEVKKIFPNPHQPRIDFDDAELKELAESISDYGVIQPIVVRVRGKGTYEIIAGERRFKASQLAGFKKVPCIITEVSDSDSLVLALVENIHRVNLNPIEEARAYEALIEDSGITHEEISKKIKKSREYVTNILRLLALPPEVQDLVIEKKLTIGHVRPLINLNKPKVLSLVNEIMKKKLTVRDVESLVKKFKSPSSKRKKPEKMPEILEIEKKLQTRFGTKVSIDYKKGKGFIKIQFFTDNDLNRILEDLEIS